MNSTKDSLSERPPMFRVMALHALAYCPRLFYLEEVEEIRVADARVFAGRALHEAEVDPEEAWESVHLESEAWGIYGKVDFARYRDGAAVPYEHKRGYAPREGAWPSDRLQVVAYAVLLEEHLDCTINEGRIRYHADNRTVRVAIDAAARESLRETIREAGVLCCAVRRPPVTLNTRLCARCSLAPVCLPEEERLARALHEGVDGAWEDDLEVPQTACAQATGSEKGQDDETSTRGWDTSGGATQTGSEAGQDDTTGVSSEAPSVDRDPGSAAEDEAERARQEAIGGPPHLPRLFPKDEERRILHVVEYGARVGRCGDEIVVTSREGAETRFPGRDVAAIVAHGAVQVSSQLIHYTQTHGIGVHWLTGGGSYVGGVAPAPGVQRRHRQYLGLCEDGRCLELARRTVSAKVENQLRFLTRSARGKEEEGHVNEDAEAMRQVLRSAIRADNLDTLRGCEGLAGRHYFSGLSRLISSSQAHMHFEGRSRRPPRDGFNAALSFGYSLLYREVTAVLLAVGLEPSFGFFHTPRSAAYPLALDLMELFRTTMVDMPLLASVNRGQWRPEHFTRTRAQVWLAPEGRKLMIGLYETRKQETWKHPVLGYSLSYGRSVELEARLLEKEWGGAPGLYARMRLRG